MNREKIVEIATALPREAYIDLLCAGAEHLYWKDIYAYTAYPNISYNQFMAIRKAVEEGKEEEDE